ncbi:MAG: hypothetical protein CMF31_07595 [Kordiimonas sp.]|nr:hypothetical protein [Kordiimonas sp.]|tara:strand:+ start:2471 stop:2953 length:483 start_codon:yes stop_codon:yes gene_type:complete
MKRPFWKEKSLPEMTAEEWESLCDGCARCCLHKLEDIDTGEVAYTDVSCRLLDTESCRCTRYAQRHVLVPDCVVFTADQVDQFHWLPPSCAYRLLAEGKDLYDWHPLVSGTAQSVHDSGASVRGQVVSERVAGDLQDHVVYWPAFAPESPPNTDQDDDDT